MIPKRLQNFLCQWVLIIIILAVTGCSSAISVTTGSTTAESLIVTVSPSPAPEPTPVVLPSPSPSPSPAPLPSPTPTPSPSPIPTVTPKPTIAPAPVSSKVTLAEGFYYIKLDSTIKARITGFSYPADDTNIKISYDDLRYIKLLHYDFDGVVHEGELIVYYKLADEVMAIFYELYQSKYPLTSVRLVDDYGEAADDNLSMAANNTSAFNYRFVAGTTSLSRHSYGMAIDVNPLLNPYIVGDKISPVEGAAYADRTLDFPGKIDHNDLCCKLFKAHGWSWGGDWADPDYQHFSKRVALS